jgi:uncharacterized protein YraI
MKPYCCLERYFLSLDARFAFIGGSHIEWRRPMRDIFETNTMRFASLSGVWVGVVLMGAGTACACSIRNPVNLHSGPKMKSSVIGQIPAGTDVYVLNCSDGSEGGWCEVRFGTLNGFIETSGW